MNGPPLESIGPVFRSLHFLCRTLETSAELQNSGDAEERGCRAEQEPLGAHLRLCSVSAECQGCAKGCPQGCAEESEGSGGEEGPLGCMDLEELGGVTGE